MPGINNNIYNYLSKKNIKNFPSTFEDFEERMKDEKVSKNVYALLSKDNIKNFPESYDAFVTQLNFKKKEESISEGIGLLSPSQLPGVNAAESSSTRINTPALTEEEVLSLYKPTKILEKPFDESLKEEKAPNKKKNSVWKDINWGMSRTMEQMGGGMLKFLGDVVPGKDVFEKLADVSDEWVDHYTEQMTRGNESITKKWGEGDKRGAVGEAVVQVFSQAPQLVVMATTGKPSLGVIGASTYGQKYDELKEIDMPDYLRRLNALGSAAAEVGSESLTTLPLINSAKKAVLELGKDEAKKVVEGSIKTVIKDFYASTGYRLGQATSESLSEFVAAESEALIDYVTGVKEEYTPFSNESLDQALVGLGMGGGMASMGTASDIKKAVQSLPKGLNLEQKKDAIELISKRDELKKEEERLDEAYKEPKKEKIDEINEKLKEIKPKRGGNDVDNLVNEGEIGQKPQKEVLTNEKTDKTELSEQKLETSDPKKPDVGDTKQKNTQQESINIFDERNNFLTLQKKQEDGSDLDKTDTGRDSGGEMGKPELRRENVSQVVEGKPRYDAGGSGQGVGYTPLKEYSIPDNEVKSLQSIKPKSVFDTSFDEINNSKIFHESISKSKEGNPYAASVFVYPIDEYDSSRKFLTKDGLAGAAIDKHGTIISVFSHGKGKGRAAQMVMQAIKEGGNKLDHYDTRLSQYYYDFGFVPVARVKWNDEFAPDDWNKETFKEYNKGEPDVVLMAYQGGDPNTLHQRYGRFGEIDLSGVPYYDSFEDAQNAQDKYVKKVNQQKAQTKETKQEISFTFHNERRFGEVIEEKNGNIKVKEPSGTIHTITKNSAFYKDVVKDPKIIEQQKKENTFEENFREMLNKEKSEKPTTSGFSMTKKGHPKKLFQIFNKQRGVPTEAYKGNLKVTGKVNRTVSEANQLGNDLTKAAKKAYDNYGEKEQEQLQTALENMGKTEESKQAALKDVPQELHGLLVTIRDNIDNMSREIMKMDILSDDLQVKFEDNRGFYLTRTYKRNKDKSWTWKNIPDKTKLDAAKKIHEYFPDLSKENVKGIMKSMLMDSEIKSLTAGNYGSVNKDILKKRSEFLTDNPELREFLGEYRNPAYNYTVSMAKMTELVERTKQSQIIAELGLKNGWLKEEVDGDHNVKIGTDTPFSFGISGDKVVIRTPSSKGNYKPLSDYYTTPEIAKAFNNFKDVTQFNNKWMPKYLQAVTGVKLAKTAFSVKGIVRNFLSNPINLIGNGNWNFHDIAIELSKYSKGKTAKEAFRELINEMKEFNIIGDNVDTGAIIVNLKDIDKAGKKNILDNHMSRAMLKAYSFGDDFWKTMRFLSEKARYQKVFEKQGKENAEQLAKEKAMEILHDTTAFYSQQPQLLQSLRKLPFAGTFVSFPYLTTRNFFHTMALASKEMGSKDTFHIGMQRMSGLGGAIVVLSLLALRNTSLNGMDEEDLKDVRRFLPSFWKNDIIGIKENSGKGKLTYKNYSFMDYYGAITIPLTTMYRSVMSKGKLEEEDLFNALGSFFEPYVSEDILFSKLKNLYQNYDPGKKQKINDVSFTDEPLRFFITSSVYLWDAFEPATITDIRRIARYKKAGEDWKTPLRGVATGQQNRVLDVSKSLRYYNIKDAEEKIKDAQWEYKQKTYKNKGNFVLQSTKQQMESTINKQIKSLTEDYEAAKRLGLDEEQMFNIFKDSKLDKDVRNAVLYGGEVRLSEDGKIIPK